MNWFELIQWIVPLAAGGVGWWVARINRRVDSQKQLLDTLDRQAYDIAKLYEEMGFIRRAVERRNVCRYIAVCPVDTELRKFKDFQSGQRKSYDGQREGEGNNNNENFDGSTVTGRPPPRFV